MAELTGVELHGGLSDSDGVKSMFGEILDGAGKRIGSLFGKEDTVLPGDDEILTATISVSDYWTASSKSFDSSNAKRLKARKKVSFSVLEVKGEFGAVEPRDEANKLRIAS